VLEEHRIILDLLFLAEVAPNLVTECEDGLNDLLLIELVVFIFFLALSEELFCVVIFVSLIPLSLRLLQIHLLLS